jgi:hypothetical protein
LRLTAVWIEVTMEQLTDDRDLQIFIILLSFTIYAKTRCVHVNG